LIGIQACNYKLVMSTYKYNKSL